MGATVKRYKVTAPCVVHIPTVTASGPTLGTFYRDAILPVDVPAGKLQHLVESNMVVEIDEAGQPVKTAAKAAEPSAPAEPASSVSAPAAPAGSASGDQPPAKPNARTNKADLVTYAVANSDLTREQAEAMTLRDLQARFVKAPEQQPPSE